MNPQKMRYIVVEGPIGAGKTSLANALAAHFDADTLLEAPQDNPFLERFYQDMQPDANANPQIGKRTVIVERVARRVGRRVEQQEKAVGTANLAAVMTSDQVARPAIVRCPDFRGAGVTETLDHAHKWISFGPGIFHRMLSMCRLLANGTSFRTAGV